MQKYRINLLCGVLLGILVGLGLGLSYPKVKMVLNSYYPSEQSVVAQVAVKKYYPPGEVIDVTIRNQSKKNIFLKSILAVGSEGGGL